MSTDRTDTNNRAEPIRTTLGLLPLIALSAALTGPAHAQDGATVLGEINVEGQQGGASGTGYKRDRIQSKKATAPLVNTPQTVTVVPEQVIQERGADDLVQVLRNTPGISLDAGENAFGSGGTSIFIRGQNATGSVFTDGARDNGSYTRDTFNVEQVEVAKGVASDNGRGGGAGYVNIATKTPTLNDFVRGSARVGFDDDGRTRARSTVDVNKSVDNFAFRFNGMAEGGDVLGRDVADGRTWGVAPSLAYGLGTDFRAIFAYEHVERNDLPDSGVTFNRGGRSLWIPGAGPNSTPSTFPRDTFFGEQTDFDKVKSDAALARFEYDFSNGVSISNQTRWSNVDRSAEYRTPAPTGIGTLRYYDRENSTLSNLTNISAEFETGSFKHSLAAGLEFSREKSDAIRGGNENFTSDVDVRTVAAYVYDTVELTEQWLVTGGLRAERYDVDIDIVGGSSPTSYSNSDTTLGGKLGVIYKPRPEGSIYASYGLSHLPHGSHLSNPDISRNDANSLPGLVQGAKPVAAHNYEVGAKWDFFGGDLTVTGALFRTEKHNVAYNGAAGDPAIVYGKQIIQGLELGVAGNITAAWSVFGGLTLLDTERKHGAAVDRALAGDYGANGAYFPAVTTTNGDELAFTPKVSASLWSTYRWSNGLTLGGGVQYVGESWIGRPDDALRVIPNGKFGKLPDYFLVNLMAAYEVNDNITLRFNVDNVFNKTYLTTANWNGNWGYLGAPRTYRFGTSFRF